MIKAFTSDDSLEWERIVSSFVRHDVYYRSGYVNTFKSNGDGEPWLIYYEDSQMRGMNVVMRRDVADMPCFKGILPLNEYFDIVTVYGYGGWLLEPKGDATLSIDALNVEYCDFCKKHHIVDEFVRFHPLLRNWEGVESMYDCVALGNTVCIDTSSEVDVWNNFSAKNRNCIRKAQKSGLKVYWSRTLSIIEPFMEIYNQTMRKDHAIDYYFFRKEFYQILLEELKFNALWFYAMLDDEIAAISIFLFDNGNMHYHLSASRPEYQHLAPGNLLLWEAAQWACHNGLAKLHLGGGVGSSHDSLYKFKKAFNYHGDDLEFHIGKKVFDATTYDYLLGQRKQVDSTFTPTSFFPAYRS